MSASGLRKAALLLMGLDPSTAGELLKAAEPEVVTQIAAELAYLQAAGDADRQTALEPVREFYHSLRDRQGAGQGFLRAMLQDALGADKAREAMDRVADLVEARDPFLAIRSAGPEAIAEALRGESPHVASLVLAELPSATSAQLLPLLDEDVRGEAIRGMTREEAVTPETRLRVASVVRKRLEQTQSAGGQAGRQQQLRKVAVLLRGLGTDLRSSLIRAIAEADEETSTEVQRLMVTWEDVASLTDRSLQEALRAVDTRNLALSLHDADPQIVQKIRSNISERQAAMLDEEATLISSPRREDIDEARGAVLTALRELAAGGLLTFEED